jgi:hypothetical protein
VENEIALPAVLPHPGRPGADFHGAVNFAITEFYEVQPRAEEHRSVRRVMSSSCSQRSPTKE